ncbi:hypothetical protein ACBJ59_10770 [Nonomuraea sp. MTCD27]|uniref:hypothetical protein n=1 Tax=Nonomuraea sp. MTCD27 TaxID=1676747 RepID=UPI0035C1FA7A
MPISPDSCPGKCNRRYREAWTDYDLAAAEHVEAILKWVAARPEERGPKPEPPAPPTVPYAVAAPAWCGRCCRTIRVALAELDDTAALLSAAVDGHRGAALAGPNGASAPDHKTIIDTLDEAFGFLVEVEDQWREARRYPARPRRARGAHARAVTVGWLLDQLDDILLHSGSVEFGLGVLRWQRRLRVMAKADPVAKGSPIRCPRCKERQVSRRDDGYFECVCGRLLTQQEHDREYAEQADEHDHQRQEVGA